MIAARCTGHDYSQPGKPQARLGRPGREGRAGRRRWSTTRTRWWPRSRARTSDEAAASALALLALVAGQDVEPAEGSDGRDGRWRIARKVAEDRVISTVDPAGPAHPQVRRRPAATATAAHLAADPETGIITGEKLTMASGDENSDAGGRRRVRRAAAQAAAAERGRQQPLAWYGDSAYGTGELRAALAAGGHQAVIKPQAAAARGPRRLHHRRLRRRSSAAGTVDLPRRDHPAGHAQPAPSSSAPPAAAARSASSAPPPRAAGTLTLHRARRPAPRRPRRVARPARRTTRRYRPNVERAIAQVATQRGRRLKLRYRGAAPNDAWLKPAPPPSTSATSSAAASPAATAPGPWPPDQRRPHGRPSRSQARPRSPASATAPDPASPMPGSRPHSTTRHRPRPASAPARSGLIQQLLEPGERGLVGLAVEVPA